MAINGVLKFLTLKIISSGEIDGISIIKSIEKITQWKVSYGSFYPLMKNLVDLELVSFRKENGSKVYSITKKGEKLLKNISKQKEEIISKIGECVKSLEILGNEDFFEQIKKYSEEKHLSLISIYKELSEQYKILKEINIPKNQNSINKILKDANAKLKKLQ